MTKVFLRTPRVCSELIDEFIRTLSTQVSVQWTKLIWTNTAGTWWSLCVCVSVCVCVCVCPLQVLRRIWYPGGRWSRPSGVALHLLWWFLNSESLSAPRPSATALTSHPQPALWPLPQTELRSVPHQNLLSYIIKSDILMCNLAIRSQVIDLVQQYSMCFIFYFFWRLWGLPLPKTIYNSEVKDVSGTFTIMTKLLIWVR